MAEANGSVNMQRSASETLFKEIALTPPLLRDFFLFRIFPFNAFFPKNSYRKSVARKIAMEEYRYSAFNRLKEPGCLAFLIVNSHNQRQKRIKALVNRNTMILFINVNLRHNKTHILSIYPFTLKVYFDHLDYPACFPIVKAIFDNGRRDVKSQETILFGNPSNETDVLPNFDFKLLANPKNAFSNSLN